MRRIGVLGLVAAAVLAAPAAVLALSQSSIPAKFGLAWGQNAGAPYIRSIPQTSQIGIQNCAASLNDGFPPLTFTPATAGGCPPFGQDFNGILKQLSQWAQWQSAGGPVFYDGTFASTVGGYPSGAILSSAVTLGTRWLNTVDNNTTNPDAGGAGWVQDPGQIPVGTPVQSQTTTIPYGYVSENGTTIGDASSNATQRANADTLFLFVFVWNNCGNTQCPIFTSAGSASVRGGSCTVAACADYAAHKALAVPNLNGTTLMGADSQNGSSSSNLLNVPVTSGSRTAPLSILGENLHVLTVGELAQHNHGITEPNGGLGHSHSYSVASGTNNYGVSSSFALNGLSTVQTGRSVTGITINNTGSDTPHNTVARSAVVYWNMKL